MEKADAKFLVQFAYVDSLFSVTFKKWIIINSIEEEECFLKNLKNWGTSQQYYSEVEG
jgi:hypothetical protein